MQRATARFRAADARRMAPRNRSLRSSDARRRCPSGAVRDGETEILRPARIHQVVIMEMDRAILIRRINPARLAAVPVPSRHRPGRLVDDHPIQPVRSEIVDRIRRESPCRNPTPRSAQAQPGESPAASPIPASSSAPADSRGESMRPLKWQRKSRPPQHEGPSASPARHAANVSGASARPAGAADPLTVTARSGSNPFATTGAWCKVTTPRRASTLAAIRYHVRAVRHGAAGNHGPRRSETPACRPRRLPAPSPSASPRTTSPGSPVGPSPAVSASHTPRR